LRALSVLLRCASGVLPHCALFLRFTFSAHFIFYKKEKKKMAFQQVVFIEQITDSPLLTPESLAVCNQLLEENQQLRACYDQLYQWANTIPNPIPPY